MAYISGKKAVAYIFILFLSGCGGPQVPPSKLVRPADELMRAPDRLPDLEVGEDIGQHAIKIRKLYGKTASRFRRLQRYVRTVTR